MLNLLLLQGVLPGRMGSQTRINTFGALSQVELGALRKPRLTTSSGYTLKSEPTFVWRESGKPFRTPSSQFTRRRFEPKSSRPQQSSSTRYQCKVYLHLCGGRVENNFGNTPLSTPDRNLNLDLSVISSLVYCESSTLNYAATKVGFYLQYKKENNGRDNTRRKSESKDSPEKERCEPIPKPKAKTPSKPGDIRLEIKLSIRWDYGKFWVLRTSPQTLENSYSPPDLCGLWATDDK
uniref:Uncharacterized protein n=1 Tax=Timema cristinae TaxID=61476 RepID=A0A7R9D1E4_TIMCR|nr:unnamed protein product [Timema cristinae]